jgi:hypothetical protein
MNSQTTPGNTFLKHVALRNIKSRRLTKSAACANVSQNLRYSITKHKITVGCDAYIDVSEEPILFIITVQARYAPGKKQVAVGYLHYCFKP